MIQVFTKTKTLRYICIVKSAYLNFLISSLFRLRVNYYVISSASLGSLITIVDGFTGRTDGRQCSGICTECVYIRGMPLMKTVIRRPGARSGGGSTSYLAIGDHVRDLTPREIIDVAAGDSTHCNR